MSPPVASPAVDPVDGDCWTVVPPGEDAVTVRRATPADADAFVAMHDRCSAETLRHRYFTPAPDLGPSLLRSLLANDAKRHSLVAVDADGNVIAHAQLRIAEHAPADVTLLVEDAHQRHGIGAALARILASLGTSSGVRKARGTTQPDNWRLFGALVKAGLDAELTYEGDIPLLSATLPPRRP